MIPYVHVPVLIDFGPVQIYTFGALVGLAIIGGLQLLILRARQLGLNPTTAEYLHYWAVGMGLVLGHIFTVLFYTPERLSSEGIIALLKVWDGMSSLGGILGGLTVGLIYLRIQRVRMVPYLDAFFYAFTFSWTLARLGCSLVHDHPGQLTDSLFAVAYPCDPASPEGPICPRYDLGLYEFVAFSGLSLFFYLTRFRPRFEGFYILTWGIVMGPLRFFGDFLRIPPTPGVGGDLRYFVSDSFVGLTPAQVVLVPVFILSIVMFFRWRRVGRTLTPRALKTGSPHGEGPKRKPGGQGR